MQATTPTTIEELAAEAAGYFETAERADGSSFVRTKDNRPDWLTELIYEAHGDLLPDDWRYACISAALDFIEEGCDPDDGPSEFADGHVDVYTHARLAWLSSNLTRPGYVDEARSEGLTSSETDIVEAIGVGQYLEAQEVFASVYQSLTNRLEELELEEA